MARINARMTHIIYIFFTILLSDYTYQSNL
jgi:hypothetical protein